MNHFDVKIVNFQGIVVPTKSCDLHVYQLVNIYNNLINYELRIIMNKNVFCNHFKYLIFNFLLFLSSFHYLYD